MSRPTRAPSGYLLQQIIAFAQQTLESLRLDHGQVIDDDETALAALADEGVDVNAVITRLAHAALDAKADAAAATERIADLAQRRDRFRRHEAMCRATLLQVLQALDLRSFKDPEFGLSLRDGAPRVVVTDLDALPAEYVQITATATPDLSMIRAALQRGGTVAGAVLSNASPVLMVRST